MKPDDLLDHRAIVDVVLQYALGVDSRDWALYRACFADEVEVDLSSWNGQPSARMAAADWVAGVRAGLSGFDTTQHLNTNHRVELDGDRARCRSAIRASHHLEGECCVLGGHYDHGLIRTDAGWRIARNVLNVTWREGPEELFGRAAERAARSGDASV